MSNSFSDQPFVPQQIPAPIPPWARPVQSPMVQIITGADTIDLGPDVTYLGATVPNGTPPTPYKIQLPNGNYQRQMKRIMIQGTALLSGAEYQVYGNIVNANSLLFNNQATEAVLEWDLSAWHVIGGSVQLSTTNT